MSGAFRSADRKATWAGTNGFRNQDRVKARLPVAGHRVKAASRRATPLPGAEAVRFDWYDPTCFDDALAGTDRVYLVPPIGDRDPAAVMLPFLRRARAAGVARAVLLSSSAIAEGGPAVGAVHRALPGLFEQWAVLRPSWFMQNFTGTHAHADSIRDQGTIMTAAGTGRVGFVDADDIAAVAVQALTQDRAPTADPVLTGPGRAGSTQPRRHRRARHGSHRSPGGPPLADLRRHA